MCTLYISRPSRTFIMKLWFHKLCLIPKEVILPMNQTANDKAVLFATGDIILDEPDPESFARPSAALLKSGDFVLGQIEVPHTKRGIASSTDVPAPPSDPENLKALTLCGFNICTTAGNHAHDNGLPGIEDTRKYLEELGIKVTGTGRNIREAEAPAIVTEKNIRVGVLAFNAVGPREGWATSAKAGVSYVNILTHYEVPRRGSPGLPAAVYTFPEPDSVKNMERCIRALRPLCDVLIVALHKGMVHLHSTIQMYETPLSHAAIDAGADAVIGHHAHILRGIEVYHGKPIYHNLGNFICVTHALTPSGDNNSPERLEWIKSRKKLFGFSPDPDMPFYPFNPESRNTMVARMTLTKEGISEFGFVPCRIDGRGAPVPLTEEDKARPVIEYIEGLQKEEELECSFEWAGGWVRVH
jgi:hypothetical protein